MGKKPIIVLTGPTAAGKSALGISLAKKINGQIISADAMQIYRGMDIGSAKATQAEREEIRHHMLDVADPTEAYSVARFVAEAGACIEQVFAMGAQPIVVGGTGLYIDRLLDGQNFAHLPQNDGLRTRLAEEYDTLGGQVMWENLSKVDEASAKILHPNDKRRIVRALEVYELTGLSIRTQNADISEPPYRSLYIALTAKHREALYARIDQRVDLMLAEGLLDEVKQLVEQGVRREHTAMQGIGYKELLAVLSGETDMETAVEKMKQESRRYAKRQLSWIRRRADVNWLTWEEKPDDAYLLTQALGLWETFSGEERV